MKKESLDDGKRRLRLGIGTAAVALLIGCATIFVLKLPEKQKPAPEETIKNTVTPPPPEESPTADEDKDGLYDVWERKLCEANREDKFSTKWDVQPLDDPDGDGYGNIDEQLNGTDPLQADTHPLAGLRRLFLTDGSHHRLDELTYEKSLSADHPHISVTVEHNDKCWWKFVPVPERPHHYRIFCAWVEEGASTQTAFDKELTYQRSSEEPDEYFPSISLENDDPCEWKVHHLPRAPHSNDAFPKLSSDNIPLPRYEIFCVAGPQPWNGESLSWIETDDEERVKRPTTLATLGENGRPAWTILPAEGELSSPPEVRKCALLVVMPRSEDKGESIQEAIQKKGPQVVKCEINFLDGNQVIYQANGASFAELSRSLQPHDGPVDPVTQWPAFPARTSIQDVKSPSTFPLVIPFSNTSLSPSQISEIRLKIDGFALDTEVEELEHFQKHLIEDDFADGRIYGKKAEELESSELDLEGSDFLYFFVNWSQ